MTPDTPASVTNEQSVAKLRGHYCRVTCVDGCCFTVSDFRHAAEDAWSQIVHDLLVRAGESISSAERLLEQEASEELILVGLHCALRSLGDITGETTTDEILGQIFSTFCIGK